MQDRGIRGTTAYCISWKDRSHREQARVRDETRGESPLFQILIAARIDITTINIEGTHKQRDVDTYTRTLAPAPRGSTIIVILRGRGFKVNRFMLWPHSTIRRKAYAQGLEGLRFVVH